MTKKAIASLVAAANLSLLNSAPAQAQAMLEEVVVTARKQAESLMDAPVAVSVVSGKTMENQGVTNLEQISAKVPGLQLGRAAFTSQGVEIETQFALSDAWEVGASAAYLDSEYDDFDGAPCTIYQIAAVGPTCSQDLSGERGPNAPEWSGTVYARYTKSLNNNLALDFDVNGNYKDDYYLDGDLDPNALQDAYVKVNARLALRSQDGVWEAALYGRNLTDETTYTFVVDSPLSAGIYSAWVEEPRIIGLQGQYNF